MRITPAAVAREAGRSRNPLYTTHRDILDEINAAAEAPGPGKDLAARVAELEAIIAELRAQPDDMPKKNARSRARTSIFSIGRARPRIAWPPEKRPAHIKYARPQQRSQCDAARMIMSPPILMAGTAGCHQQQRAAL